MIDRPNLAYYRANEGRWRARFALVVTDWDAFQRCKLTPLNRLRVQLLSRAPNVVGPFILETRVDATSRASANEVVHTTHVTKWGMPTYDAEEVFTLHPNGKDVAIKRRERMWPSPVYAHEEGLSRGEIEPNGRCAHYVFPFLGTTMRQTGSIEEGGVRIIQETAFSRSDQLLVRL